VVCLGWWQVAAREEMTMTKAAMAMAEAAAVMEVAVEPAVAVRRSGRDGVAGAFSSVESAGWC